MGRQMWVPSSADVGDRTFIAGIDTSRPVIDRCMVPTGPDSVCGTPFYEGEERVKERHIVACCKRNHEHIVAERQKRHPDILKPWDTDLAAWIARHREAILEGRKRI